jgi:aryl-alcohol dehydrogenase-like predicted oxidoreductase
MKQRKLGRSGIKVSEIGFGTWGIGGDIADTDYAGFASYGPTDDNLSRAAIKRALELGVTLFDTADVFGHGHAEALVGEVLESWPKKDEIVVVAKGGINFYRKGEIPELDFTPYSIANSVQHSRARLKREKLDIYLLMGAPAEILAEKEYIRKTLESLQNVGHIGAIGISAESTEHALAVLNSGFPLDIIETPISLFDQSALIELLPLAKRKRVGIIAREPLANGFLTGKYSTESAFAETDMRNSLPIEYRQAMTSIAGQLDDVLSQPSRTLTQAALRFVLDQAGIACTAVGLRTPAQVDENIQAASLPPLTDDEIMAIHRIFFPEDF